MSVHGPYPAIVVEVHDGDTVHLNIDQGFGIFMAAYNLITGEAQLSCRVCDDKGMGINAPELGTLAGNAARAYARLLLPIGTKVQLTSYGWDKYGGRFDGAIRLPDRTDFATTMVQAGYAVSKAY